MLGPKTFFDGKMFGPKIILGPKNIFCPNFFLGSSCDMGHSDP